MARFCDAEHLDIYRMRSIKIWRYNQLIKFILTDVTFLDISSNLCFGVMWAKNRFKKYNKNDQPLLIA